MGTPSKSPHSMFRGGGSSSSGSPSPRSAKPFVKRPLPDITQGYYATDKFRMYSYKVKKCFNEGNHDWSRCPYTHTGDSTRRRDPDRCAYEWKPCESFTRGSCEYGDECMRSHGDYEKGFHPDFYKTELCPDKPPCTRQLCVYAHTREELRKPSVNSSAYSRICDAIASGFEPAPCPIPVSPPTPVTRPTSQSYIEIFNNAPNNPVESSNEQNIPSQPSLSAANSPLYNPLDLEGLSYEQSLPPQSSLSESPSTIQISNTAPDYPLEGSSSNGQSLRSQPSTSEGSSLNEQSLPSQTSLSEPLSNITISNNDPDNPLKGLSLNEQSLLPQPSVSESPSTILIPDSAPDDPLEGLSSNIDQQSLPSQPSLSESPSTTAISPYELLEGLSSNEHSTDLFQPSLSAPALQATQPQQTDQNPSSSNPAPASSSSDADNSSDNYYWDVSWVDTLLDES